MFDLLSAGLKLAACAKARNPRGKRPKVAMITL
jgi:hypothetical protein